METVSRAVLTFLLNAIWQAPIAYAVAALGCRLMPDAPARHRHAVWVAALAAALLAPVASIRMSVERTAAPHYEAVLTVAEPGSVIPTAPAATAAAAPSQARSSRTISLAQTTAWTLMGAYLLFVLYRVLRLGWAWVRTMQIRHAARAFAMPEMVRRAWVRGADALGVTGVELMVSKEVSGPVTAGRTIILPTSMLAEESEDILTTAIGHEMAHIARHDFASNLLYELLLLPVSFHPVAWLIRSGIERTREVACDELVTRRLMDAGVYARSVVSIATGMAAMPQPGYTLGVFDGDILEERIRRLIERPAQNLRRARLLLVTGLSALAVCGVIASSLALTARAQGGAHYAMKLAEAAFNRGDYTEAIAQFENAVKLEPDNVKAKLFLARTLLQEFIPGTEAGALIAARARQQYLDVLSLEPGNRPAVLALMSLAINSKQFAEAHDWAVRAIQGDATDPIPYYSAAFVDWSMTYPDYGAARAAAGMRQEDSGNIPDAGLRQRLRAQHGAHVEDGHRMLAIAVQLNPDFADAMAYENLLDRIEAGMADTPQQAADWIAKADEWVGKALDAKRRMANKPRPAAQPLNVDNPAYLMMVVAPPPPPPPPPPGTVGAGFGEAAQRFEAVRNSPGAIQVVDSEQAKRLVRQTAPVAPSPGATGLVQLAVTISKEGRVQNIRVLKSAGMEMDVAAMQAVKEWVYSPTLVNGEPVVVATIISVKFGN
jgi:TonB family protein